MSPHDGEIMRDEDQRKPELPSQVDQQVHDLRLDRHVERAHRLVADDELRLEHERPRNPDALTLAARELVRIAVQLTCRSSPRARSISAHRRAHSPRATARAGGSSSGSRHDVADRHPRIQRRERILEDHLQVALAAARNSRGR